MTRPSTADTTEEQSDVSETGEHSGFVTTTRETIETLIEEYETVGTDWEAKERARQAALYAAIAIDRQTETPTLGEIAELTDEATVENAYRSEIGQTTVDPDDLAIAAYAYCARTYEWGFKQSTLSETTFSFLHNELPNFRDLGRELIENESDPDR